MKTDLSTLTEALGWTLVHSIWQGAAIAALLWIALRFLRIQRPTIRYGIACFALGVMAITAGLTFLALYERPAAVPDIVLPHSSNPGAALPASSNPEDSATNRVTSSYSALAPNLNHSDDPAAFPSMSIIVAFWIVGVALFSLRFLFNWGAVHRLRTRNTSTVDPEWNDRFSKLRRQLGVTRSILLLSSSRLASPLTFGWIKPIILIPADLFAGLNTRQVEAVLAHELAHIRRHDYLVNLLQNVLETLFFYHPAVWWISSIIREEREHCCDDIAAGHGGDRLSYARALTSLESLRSQTPALALAAVKGPLLTRVRRLLGLNPSRPSTSLWPTAILGALLLAGSIPWLNAEPEEPTDPDLPSLTALIESSDASKDEIISALTTRLETLTKNREEQASDLKYGLLNPKLSAINEEIREIETALEPLLKDKNAEQEASEETRIPSIKEDLENALVELHLEQARLDTKYGPKHPKMLEVAQELKRLEGLIEGTPTSDASSHSDFERVTIPLQFLNARQVEVAINKALRLASHPVKSSSLSSPPFQPNDYLYVTSDSQIRLRVIGPPAEVARINELVKQLDVPSVKD